MGQVKSKNGSVKQVVGLLVAGVRRLARPRAGFGDFTLGMMELYRSHVQELFISGFDPSVVLGELTAYHDVLDQERTLEAQLAQLQETRMQHAANVWTAMLTVYQRARSAARTNATIRHAIAGFEQFMKTGHHKKAATAPLAG